MPRAYSFDLRERVVRAVQEEGLSRRAAAERFAVAVSTAIHWVRRAEEMGSPAAGKIGGYKPRKISGAHDAWLAARCRDGSHYTIARLVRELAERGVVVDQRAVWSFLREQGLSFKKGHWRPASASVPMSPGGGASGSNIGL